MFTKGQNLTIKKRGADASVKQFAGRTAQVLRGGKNVTLSLSNGEGQDPTTVKVAATALATSVLKS